MAKNAPNKGVRLVKIPARPGPINSTARIKNSWLISEGQMPTKATSQKPLAVGQ